MHGTKAGCRACAVHSHEELGLPGRMEYKNPEQVLWGSVWSLEWRLLFPILFASRAAQPQQGCVHLACYRGHSWAQVQTTTATAAAKASRTPAND